MTVSAIKMLEKLDAEQIRRELKQLDARRTILEETLQFAGRVRSLVGQADDNSDGGPKRGTLADRIAAWLKEHGPAMPKQIAAGAGCGAPSAGTTMRKDKRFKRTPKGWVLR